MIEIGRHSCAPSPNWSSRAGESFPVVCCNPGSRSSSRPGRRRRWISAVAGAAAVALPRDEQQHPIPGVSVGANRWRVAASFTEDGRRLRFGGEIGDHACLLNRRFRVRVLAEAFRRHTNGYRLFFAGSHKPRRVEAGDGVRRPPAELGLAAVVRLPAEPAPASACARQRAARNARSCEKRNSSLGPASPRRRRPSEWIAPAK